MVQADSGETSKVYTGVLQLIYSDLTKIALTSSRTISKS